MRMVRMFSLSHFLNALPTSHQNKHGAAGEETRCGCGHKTDQKEAPGPERVREEAARGPERHRRTSSAE